MSKHVNETKLYGDTILLFQGLPQSGLRPLDARRIGPLDARYMEVAYVQQCSSFGLKDYDEITETAVSQSN